MRPLALALVLSVCASRLATAQPLAIVHSGHLIDGNDQPITRNALPMEFRLFNVRQPGDTAEVLIWQSSTCPVNMTNGYYAVTLGEACNGTPALEASHVPPGQIRFLELTVDGTRMLPRVALHPMPAALVAATSLDAQALEANLATAGILNAPTNPVAWTKVKGVPSDLEDGDDVGVYTGAAGGGVAVNGGQISLRQDCAAGETLTWNGTAWACDPGAQPISVGAGLTGTGTPASALTVGFGGSGTATLAARADHTHPAQQKLVTGTVLSGQTVDLTSAGFTAAPTVLLGNEPLVRVQATNVTTTGFKAVATTERGLLWSIRQGHVYGITPGGELLRDFDEPGATSVHSGITYDPSTDSLWILQQNPGGKLSNLSVTGTVISTVTVPADVRDMVKYDPSDNTFWATGAGTFVSHLSRAGAELTRFTVAGSTGLRGVCVDPADQTLWAINESGDDTLFHLGRTGTVLSSQALSALPDNLVDLVRLDDGTFWMSNQTASNRELLHVDAGATVILERIPVFRRFGQSNPIGMDLQRTAISGVPLNYIAVGN